MRSTRRRYVAWLMPFLLLAGVSCQGDVEGFRTEERDGVTWVLNTGPGVWAGAGAEEPPVEFVLEQTFGADLTPEEAILGSVGYVDVDGDGNVYVLDRQGNRLVAFDSQGSVLWRVGAEGEGPGEFQRPRGMALDGAGSVFVSNQSGGVLDQFDLQGEFLDRYTFHQADVETFNLDGFLESGLMVGHDFLDGAVGTRLQVLRRGEPMELVAEREVNLHPELEVPAGVSGGVGVRVSGDEVLVGHDGHYEIRVFDSSLELDRVVARPGFDGLVRAGVAFVGGGGGIAMMGQLAPALVLPGGGWIVYASWPSGVEDPDDWMRKAMQDRANAPDRGPTVRLVDFFDPEHRFLGGFRWTGEEGPDIGLPSLVGPDGKLYTVLYDPFPQVRRYQVVVGSS